MYASQIRQHRKNLMPNPLDVRTQENSHLPDSMMNHSLLFTSLPETRQRFTRFPLLVLQNRVPT